MKESSIFVNPPHLMDHHVSKTNFAGIIHFHNKDEILFLVEGKITEICNAHTVEVVAPAVIILPANSIHLINTTNARVYNRYKMFFSTSLVEGSSAICQRAGFYKGKDLVIINLSQEQKDTLITTCERIKAYSHDPDAFNHLVLWFLYELSYMSDLKQNCAVLSSKKPYIAEVIQYISSHFDTQITLDSLADTFFVSRAKLVSDFKKSTGMTVGTYLTLIRMNKAKMLLEDGLSVTQVSHRCGYSAESHFINIFREHFGITPKHYSITHKNTDSE